MGTKSVVKKAVISSTFATGIVLTAPLVVDAALGDQPLQKGMAHPDVKELQEALKAKGYFTYPTATGYYGTYTEEAVKRFQQTHNIETSGIANTNTIHVLLNTNLQHQALATQIASATTRSALEQTTGILRIGSRGQAVTELQEKLKETGFFHQNSTGYYGTVTQEAVREYQRKHRLLVDGIAGPQTIAHILERRSSQQTSTTQQSRPNTQIASATASASSALAQTTGLLRAGSQGQAVTELQQKLKDAGYFNTNTTGYFGRVTENAVREYQRRNGLTVDGIVGAQTRSHILGQSSAPASSTTSSGSSQNSSPSSSTANASTSSSNVQSNGTLRVGSRGADVRKLQESLKQLGFFNHNVTDYFGTITDTAVRSFQRSQRITVDGIVGPQTMRAIEAAASGAAPSGEQTVENPTQTKSEQTQAPQSNVGGFQVMNVVADAAQLTGVPYLWGGTTPSGFDCSGLVQYVFKKNGLNIPRTVAQQWSAGKSVDKPNVGDLVFFETISSGPSHNGIYIGNNQFIHSGSSTGVTVASMNNSYWAPRYLGAKRLH